MAVIFIENMQVECIALGFSENKILKSKYIFVKYFEKAVN